MTTEVFESECLKTLAELELNNKIVERFGVFGSSSWVLLKNNIFERSIPYLKRSKLGQRPAFFWLTIGLIAISLWNYLFRIIRFAPQDLFVGAGSGVFSYKGELLDSYLPEELSSTPGKPTDETLYLLSADHVSKMWEQRAYLRRHQAVIYSFLVAPLRLVLGRLLAYALPLNRRLAIAAHDTSARMAEISVDISAHQILRLHARFCAGYLIYRIFLLPVRIRRAFVVSAYSNSEIVAVLRKIGVEIIEVQHGVIGPMHRGYNYATHSSLLPVPDQVYVYNKFWQHELLTAGFFTLDKIIIKKRLKYILANDEFSPFQFPYVVLTGQGILMERIASFVSEFISLNSRFHLVYVPHPSEDMDHINLIKNAARNDSHVHIAKISSATTERLIIDSVAHVSIYSSCHFDAIHFKGKTYILDVLENNIMNHYANLYPQKYLRIKNVRTLLNSILHENMAHEN